MLLNINYHQHYYLLVFVLDQITGERVLT